MSKHFSCRAFASTHLVMLEALFVAQILIWGRLRDWTRPADAFVLTKSPTMNATRYVDMLGVTAKSS